LKKIKNNFIFAQNKNKMNLLEGSILHITMPGNYTCNIIRTYYISNLQFQMYLLYEKSTGNIYWAVPFTGQAFSAMLKLVAQIVVEDGLNKLRMVTTNTIKSESTINENYILYVPSVKLSRIPSLYKFDNSKKQWNELCDYVEENDVKKPISKIINVFGLKQYVGQFL
jgi:hypothetical protein